MNLKLWPNEEKVTIVLEILRGDEPAAVICARYGVSTTQAYRWLDRFLKGGLCQKKLYSALGCRRPNVFKEVLPIQRINGLRRHPSCEGLTLSVHSYECIPDSPIFHHCYLSILPQSEGTG